MSKFRWVLVFAFALQLLATVLTILANTVYARNITVRLTQVGVVTGYEITVADDLFEIDAPVPDSDGIHQMVIEDVPTFKGLQVTARSVNKSGIWSETSNQITYPTEVCGATIGDVVAIRLAGGDATEIRRSLAGISDLNCEGTPR